MKVIKLNEEYRVEDDIGNFFGVILYRCNHFYFIQEKPAYTELLEEITKFMRLLEKKKEMRK